MRNKHKILISFAVITITLSLLFGVVYAAQNWLNFTGDEQIEQSNNDVDEIMDIMAQLNNKNITLEEAVERLEAMNPSGLAKQNKELREENKTLKDTNAQLNTDNVAKDKAYDELQQERDQIVIARDNAIAERNNLQAQYDTLSEGYSQIQTELTQANEYIEHLEAELHRANGAVANHAQNTNEAVEQARTYK